MRFLISLPPYPVFRIQLTKKQSDTIRRQAHHWGNAAFNTWQALFYAIKKLFIPYKIKALTTDGRKARIICLLFIPYKIKALTTPELRGKQFDMLFIPYKIKALTTLTISKSTHLVLFIPYKIKALTTITKTSKSTTLLFIPYKIKALTTYYLQILKYLFLNQFSSSYFPISYKNARMSLWQMRRH